jgi:hypothetical protein
MHVAVLHTAASHTRVSTHNSIRTVQPPAGAGMPCTASHKYGMLSAQHLRAASRAPCTLSSALLGLFPLIASSPLWL